MKCIPVSRAVREQIKKEVLRDARERVVEYNDRFSLDSDSVFLWVLHKELGLGATRLRRVWERFFTEMENLKEHYLTEDYTEDGEMCRRALKQIGVDLEAWYEERRQKK